MLLKLKKKDNDALKKFKQLKNKYKVPVVIQDFISRVSKGDKESY